MKLKDYIKAGFGFYIGYEIAKSLDDVGGEIFKLIKKRIKDGHC